MRLNKIFSSLALASILSVSSLFAASVADLQGNSYTVGSTDLKMSGYYVNYNSADKMWFLYMPAANYLLIHETGKSTTADGAQILSVGDFDSITVSGNIVSFGALVNTDSAGSALAGKSYEVGSADLKMSGYYVNYNSADKMWFLYMPAANYLLAHETGKSTVADGAQILSVGDVTGGINISGSTITFGTGAVETDVPTTGLSGTDMPPMPPIAR